MGGNHRRGEKQKRPRCLQRGRSAADLELIFDDVLKLARFLLEPSTRPLDPASGFHFAIVGSATSLFFDCAFKFPGAAFNPIFNTRFHTPKFLPIPKRASG